MPSNNQNRGTHGDSPPMLGAVASSNGNPQAFTVGYVTREQRRGTEKHMRSKGHQKGAAEAYVKLMEELANKKRTLNDGDKVRLNYERISSSARWDRMQPKYRKFVEGHKDAVLTVCTDPEHPGFVCFEEDESEIKWLWMEDDLIKINAEETNAID